MQPPPEQFGPEFLAWFKRATERAWATYTPRDNSDPQAPGGSDFQRGTKWLPGLSDAELDALQSKWSVKFNPDHRMFLRHLGGTTPRRVGHFFRGATKVRGETPGFYDWRADDETIRDVLALPIEGAVDDDVWPEAWPERPESSDERAKMVRAEMARWPAMVPVFGHRFTLPDPVNGHYPVFSVHQTDIIFYAANLRHYLLLELAELLGLDRRAIERKGFANFSASMSDVMYWRLIARD